MSSILKQIKLLFFIAAIVSIVCFLYAYNWNVTLNKFSTGFAQGSFARFEFTRAVTRRENNTYNNVQKQTNKITNSKLNNTPENVISTHGDIDRISNAEVASEIKPHDNSIKYDANQPENPPEVEDKASTKYVEHILHTVQASIDNKITKTKGSETNIRNNGNSSTIEFKGETSITHKSTTKEKNVTPKVNDESTTFEASNELKTVQNYKKLETTAMKDENTVYSDETKITTKVQSEEKSNGNDGLGAGNTAHIKTKIGVTNMLNPTEILSKQEFDNITNLKLNADAVASVREELKKVKERFKAKNKKKHGSSVHKGLSDDEGKRPSNHDGNPLDNDDDKRFTDKKDKPEPTRDIKAYMRVKNRLKELGFAGNKFDPFALNSNVLGGPASVADAVIDEDSDVTSRPDMCESCFKYNFKKILNEPKLCEGDVVVLILITSTAQNVYNRDGIRNTWGKVCKSKSSNIRCLFVFGTKNIDYENQLLKEESEKYHDIAQFDFYDVYGNLTYKTLSSIQWSHDFCPQAKYIMKTDDDMYVNTELLPLMLMAAPNEQFMGGMCWGPSSPHRDMNSKWYVSFVQYQHSLFPSMCSGTGYVMSRDVADGILRQSPNVPFFYLEDVYVAICVKKLNVKPLLLAGFKNVMVDFDKCAYRNRYITVHGYSGGSLESIWSLIHECPLADLTPAMIYSGVVV